MTTKFHQHIVEPKRIAQMAENMTIAQIAARLHISEADVEDNLDKAGRAGQGLWLLRCLKTGRFWRCHTERACYRKAQMMGLTDYDFGLTDQPVKPAMDLGDIDSRIAEMRGRGWPLRRIGAEVGMSAQAVTKRLKKMGAK